VTATIRAMTAVDWPAVAAIYAAGIATDDATFETEAPSWECWDAAHLAEHRLVAVDAGDVLGWAAVGPVSERCVYAARRRCCPPAPAAGRPARPRAPARPGRWPGRRRAPGRRRWCRPTSSVTATGTATACG
jgi:hypothetical protein